MHGSALRHGHLWLILRVDGQFKRPNAFGAPQALPETAGGMRCPDGPSCRSPREERIMRMRNALLASVCLTFVLGANAAPSLAEGAVALGGQVTSNEEGPMEGVLVTAKKAGS